MSIGPANSLPQTGLLPPSNSIAGTNQRHPETNKQAPSAQTEPLNPSATIKPNDTDNQAPKTRADVGEPAKQPFSEKELQAIEELKQRDQEVRVHEAAHLAGAGQYATGGASYSYKTGPDGVRYAVGGEVSVDTSPIPGDPEATLEKSRKIRAAALAPAEPSATDRAIAAEAAKMANDARMEINQEQLQPQTESAPDNKPSGQASDPDEKIAENKARANDSYLQTARNDDQGATPIIDLIA